MIEFRQGKIFAQSELLQFLAFRLPNQYQFQFLPGMFTKFETYKIKRRVRLIQAGKIKPLNVVA